MNEGRALLLLIGFSFLGLVWADVLVVGNTGPPSCNAGGLASCGASSSSQSSAGGSCVVCTAAMFTSQLGDVVVDSCSGDFHSLIVLKNGTVLGSGLLSSMGLVASSTSCTRPGALQQILILSSSSSSAAVSSVACFKNTSAFLLKNGSVAVAGLNQGGCFGVASSTLPSVGTPTVLELVAGSSFNLSVLGGSSGVSQIGMGDGALVLLASNGSVWTLGTGVLRGDGPAATPAAALLSAPCTAVSLAVGELHAVLVCTNGSAAGYGDNSHNQLALDGGTTFTIASARLLSVGGNVSAAAAGRTHSLLLDSTTGKVYGAGDNTTAALGNGFDSSASAFLEISVLSSTSGFNKVVAVGAGPGTSYFVTARSKQLAAGGFSNVLSMGTSPQCVLGYNTTSADGTPLKITTPTYLFVTSNPYVLVRRVSFSRENRVLMTTSHARTMTRTETGSATGPSRTVTSTHTAGSNTLSGLFSASASSRVRSFSRTYTLTLTSSRATPSGTHSRTLPVAPFITRVILFRSRPVVLVDFNIPTNMPAGIGSNSAAMFASLFQISGMLQSFGVGAFGFWQTGGSVFEIHLGVGANVTVGVANVQAAPFSFILSAAQPQAAPADPLQAVRVELGPPIDAGASQSSGPPDYIRAAIIASALIAFFAFLAVIGVVVARRLGWICRRSPHPRLKELRRVETQHGSLRREEASVLPPTDVDSHLENSPMGFDQRGRNFTSGTFVPLPQVAAAQGFARGSSSEPNLVGYLSEQAMSPTMDTYADQLRRTSRSDATRVDLSYVSGSPLRGIDESPISGGGRRSLVEMFPLRSEFRPNYDNTTSF